MHGAMATMKVCNSSWYKQYSYSYILQHAVPVSIKVLQKIPLINNNIAPAQPLTSVSFNHGFEVKDFGYPTSRQTTYIQVPLGPS